MRQDLNLPGLGACFLPREFTMFTGPLAQVEEVSPAERPRVVLDRLAAGGSLVLTGNYTRVDGIYRYCAHNEKELAVAPRRAASEETSPKGTVAADRRRHIAELTAMRRRRLHHLLVPARGDNLVGIEDAPDTAGLQQWLEESTGEDLFLIPVRRLQRILTDMRRAREGIPVPGLDAPITILPHVYVPADMSVPAMLREFAGLITGRRVLDMGTGTGVLALLAAQLGAREVLATDSNPKAVENVRLNAQRLGMGYRVVVRGPANLFTGLTDERFDVIVFNAPWAEGDPQSLYDTAIYDPGRRVMEAFLESAPLHLSPDGAILLQYSDVSDGCGDKSIERLTASLKRNGLFIASSRSIHRKSRLTGTGETVRFFEIRKTALAG
ncbi:MAG: 50S ribosomal protein L11 methyltransferase [bacterium]